MMKQKLLAAVCAMTLMMGVSSVYAETTQNDLAHAPVCENLEIETYRNTSVGGTLSAQDPEGEAVTYQLSTEPMKGTVEVQQDGTFVYTPGENKRGKDYFGYKAVDVSGNVSQEATVIIKIKKQKTAVTYDDMAGRPEGYAAAKLAEDGVFVGTCVAGNYLFQPEETLSRSEFLALCMTLSDTPILTGVMTTGFGDDAAIPVWAKGYVSTARMNGDVYGYSDGTRMVFAGDRAITHAEAAVLLDRIVQPETVLYSESDAVPTWASQAVANLTACSLYPAPLESDAALTRAECAVMLTAAMELMH